MIYCGIDDNKLDEDYIDAKYNLLGRIKKYLYGDEGIDLCARGIYDGVYS